MTPNAMSARQIFHSVLHLHWQMSILQLLCHLQSSDILIIRCKWNGAKTCLMRTDELHYRTKQTNS
jgi:hypothetical protein